MRKLKNSELQRIEIDDFKKIPKIPLIVVLDNVRSMNNIGSIFRTADAFIVEKIYLCGITASPPHKEIQKTALDSTMSVEWEYFNDTRELVSKLKNLNFYVWSVEQTENSQKLEKLEIKKNIKHAIILGNEVEGVSQDVINMSDNVIEISQYGTKHSLNISNCSAILIWEFFKALN